MCVEYDIIGYRRDGGYAEFVAVPGVDVIPKPKNLHWEEAAALPLVTLTAWHMLVTRAQVQPGEDVLVHAAGSGVGALGIQIAKLLGTRVIATASSFTAIETAIQVEGEIRESILPTGPFSGMGIRAAHVCDRADPLLPGQRSTSNLGRR